MNQENNNQPTNQPEDYDTPKIEGDIDTVAEEIEYLEKKKKIPVWIWILLIIVVSIITFWVTSNQSPTIIF